MTKIIPVTGEAGIVLEALAAEVERAAANGVSSAAVERAIGSLLVINDAGFVTGIDTGGPLDREIAGRVLGELVERCEAMEADHGAMRDAGDVNVPDLPPEGSCLAAAGAARQALAMVMA